MVDNISDEILGFPKDFNIQCYTYSGSEWNNIEQELIQRNKGNIIMKPSKGDPKYTLLAIVYPIIEDMKEPIYLRVVILGNIIRDGRNSDIKVGAFTDVRLIP